MISYIMEYRSKPNDRFEWEDGSWGELFRYRSRRKDLAEARKDLREARKEHGKTSQYRLLRVVSKVIG